MKWPQFTYIGCVQYLQIDADQQLLGVTRFANLRFQRLKESRWERRPVESKNMNMHTDDLHSHWMKTF